MTRCSKCNGDGWNIGHTSTCSGWYGKGCDCSGEQIQCEHCQGTGDIEDE